MPKRLHLLQLAGLIFLLYNYPAWGQQPSASSPSRSLRSILNPDGTINQGSLSDGSFDAAGFRVTLGRGGEPRFLPVPDQAPGDENWDDRFGPPGTNGVIYAMVASGTDLYLAGHFTIAGTAVARSVAKWSSLTRGWTDLSPGLGGNVYALAINGGEIYAGGTFMNTDRNGYVARWNANINNWDILGNNGIIGVFQPDQKPGAFVYALTVLGDDVYIGGDFNTADNVNSPNLVKWNRITDKFSPVSSVGVVRALASRGSHLYVGGAIASIGGVSLNNIAQYDTNTKVWAGIGSGVDGQVNVITVNGANIYVGGAFSKAGGVPSRNVARWDGTAWTGFAGGVSDTVRALAVVGSDLYVGGRVMQAGNVLANGIVRWTGASWSPLGIGVSNSTKPAVNALATDGTMLYVGGDFQTAGTITAHNAVGWDGTSWFPLGRGALKDIGRNGANGGVFAVAVNGTDVYIGGDFTRAGGFPANYIARWNIAASTWSSLGSGVGGQAPFVRAIAVSGSDVYVGGIFTTAGGKPITGIARWDGTNWSSLGTGIGGPAPYVFAIAVSGTNVYAGGGFTTAGGTSASRIARWDGTAWTSLGTGIGGVSSSASVNALLLVGPSLYVGGDFTTAGGAPANRIARWDGAAWSSLGIGTNAPVSALAALGGDVIAGGEFTTAGGTAASYIARWNGAAWAAIPGLIDAPVRALATRGTELFAGGEFTHIDTQSISRVARWNGTSWGALRQDSISNGVNGPVRAIAAAAATLYTGGEFSIAGGLRANNIAEWDGRSWSSLGSDPTAGLEGIVLAIAVKDSNVYVGGLFSSAGGMRTSGIARWDGNNWIRMGRGVNGPVRAIALIGNDVYAGGQFDTAGIVAARGVARWDGNNWSALGGGLAGSKPYVYALAASGTNLFVGGSFDSAGNVRARRVARWNGSTQSWSSLGGGIDGASFFTYVSAIAASGSDVYVGGVFPSVGGQIVNNIAHWNDGTAAWSSLGQGVTDAIFSIAIGKSGDVYAGGLFSFAGETSAANIARWDGTSWSAMGDGLNGEVYSLGFYNDELFAGGTFSSTGAVGVNHIGRWTGSNWVGVGSGVDRDSTIGFVYAIGTYPDGFYAGGDFTIAGGHPSYYFAHWRRTPFLSAPSLSTIPAGLGLYGYPNPFSSSATIGFTLAKSVHVSLKIYSLRGDEVATLASEMMGAGEHRLTWRPGNLPQGTYLYRLQGGERSESGTIELVR